VSKFKVLITDYPWSDLVVERQILEPIGAELVEPDDASESALVAAVADVDAILTTWAHVSRQVLAAAAKCVIVSRLGIGLDNIDLEFCREAAITVTNVPQYCEIEVAEHTLALIFALGRKVARYHSQTKAGIYDLQAGPPLRRLQGQTLGIVGLGNIGTVVANKAAALGLNVQYHNRTPRDSPYHFVETLPELLSTSDYVSLHVPLTDETRGLMGADELRMMKSTGYLINTARGALLDHDALTAGLQQNQIAGAALDVQDREPPDLAQPPYSFENVIVTPHAAFLSEESLQMLRTCATEQVVAKLSGFTPNNIVVSGR
jgi:D-3-phosphoglycerate dehydrogenase